MKPNTLIHPLLLATTTLLLAGCARSTRSISHSTVPPDKCHHSVRTTAAMPGDRFTYRGELSEFDLLGINRDQFVTEEQIAATLAAAGSVRLTKGETVLLIQSGAAFPDGEMVRELEAHFRVIPFSGIPSERMQSAQGSDQPAYARGFRLAAARAGADHIVCYWGALESMRTDMHTKTVSWIPFAGWVIPDENQAMRIQLRLAVIDVKTGRWTTIAESIEDENSRSNRFNRDRADQQQVRELKELSYAAGAKRLIEQSGEAVR